MWGLGLSFALKVEAVVVVDCHGAVASKISGLHDVVEAEAVIDQIDLPTLVTFG